MVNPTPLDELDPDTTSIPDLADYDLGEYDDELEASAAEDDEVDA